MKIYPAYLTGTHHYSFRNGEPAEIIGIKFIKPSEKLPTRVCYHVRFEDGFEDYVPMSDNDNFTISTGPIIEKIIPERVTDISIIMEIENKKPPTINTNTIT